MKEKKTKIYIEGRKSLTVAAPIKASIFFYGISIELERTVEREKGVCRAVMKIKIEIKFRAGQFAGFYLGRNTLRAW